MKKLLTATVFSLATSTVAFAQQAPAEDAPAPEPTVAPAPVPCCQPQPAVAYNAPAEEPPVTLTTTTVPTDQDDSGWQRPVGRRFSHGFRIGWTYIYNYEKQNREDGMSLKAEFKLKSPNMMLIGYEGFYRIVGHSWLNVLLVGNVSVAGLEQSKFIPAASGLIGVEIDRNFQLGVGVNATPDPQSPTHMIAAAGWTPKVGAINTPFHFFFVPDADGNHRMGATVGMSW